MAEHDQWQDPHWRGRAEPGDQGAGGAPAKPAGSMPGGAIDRLDAALARIAAAAGRRQDALRVAELNAQAARHEAELLARADSQGREEAAELAAGETAAREAERQAEMRALAERLDSLIAAVRAELEDLPTKD